MLGVGGQTSPSPKLRTWWTSQVRTNIEIEDTYVHTVMDRYGVRTTTAAVDIALRHRAGRPMTRDEALAVRGARAAARPSART